MFERLSLLAALAMVQLVSTPVVAAEPDRDSREISSYVLTEAAFTKYSQATRNLGAAAKQGSSHCDDDDEEEGAGSLDAAAARLDKVPAARAAIQSAGLTTREYIVFGFALFQSGMASWALSQPGGKLPPGISMANVRFYQAHEPAIKKLGIGSEDGDCDDAESDEDEEPQE